MNASDLADAIGRKRIAARLGVGPTAISNAVVRGRFPSSWFVAIRDLASEVGAECQPALFGMKSIHGTSSDGDSDAR